MYYANLKWSTIGDLVSGSSANDLTITIELVAPFYPLIVILHEFLIFVMYYANLEWTAIGYRVTGSPCTDFTIFIELAAQLYPLINILLIFCQFFLLFVDYGNLEWTTCFKNNFFRVRGIDLLLESVIGFHQRCL